MFELVCMCDVCDVTQQDSVRTAGGQKTVWDVFFWEGDLENSILHLPQSTSRISHH